VRGEELLEIFGVPGPDRAITDVLADHRSLLVFYQCIVRGPIGPRFRKLHPQLLQQPGDVIVHEVHPLSQ
jgi:hypothetical protein